MKRVHLAFPLIAVLILVRCAAAADVGALVDDLADDKKRAAAIAEILKLGAKADAELKTIEHEKKLSERQLLIVQRLIANNLINTSELKPLDVSKFVPMGEDKEKKLAGDPAILIDPDLESRARNRTLVLNAEFGFEQGPLEYLVVTKGSEKKHETVVAVDARPQNVFFALLACEYADAGPVGENGAVHLPKDSGVLMSVEFDWETPNEHTGENTGAPESELKPDTKPSQPNPNLRHVRVPIEFFAHNRLTGKTMKRVPFAFTGSKVEKDSKTGRSYFLADFEKTIAAVRVDEISVLNSPLDTGGINPRHANGYAFNWSCVPAAHAPCKLIFEPYTGPQLSEAELTDSGEAKGEMKGERK